MPKDSSGKFHLSTQKAMSADKAKPGKPEEKPMGKPMEAKPQGAEAEGGMSSTLHDHGDGTFHTVSHDGAEEQHPSIGHALMHIASQHSEGKHVHAHHDGGGKITSHHVGHMGGVEGPTEHGSPDEAGQHAAMVLGEGDEQPMPEEHMSGGAMNSLQAV